MNNRIIPYFYGMIDSSKPNSVWPLRLYLILAALFICSLVVSNLIFQKFFYWQVGGYFRFELSVGIIAYPVTFLVTDLISEIYGKERATDVVIAGLAASVFALAILYVADLVPAIAQSPVNNETFTKVFSASSIAVAASMIAYLLAQFVDVRIYHFWKNLTNGRHLWLRNNFSTIFSQLLDTFTVLFLLCSYEIIEWSMFGSLFMSGFLFKLLVALVDTPFLYLGVYGFRKAFGLKLGEELKL